ncbi:unnamed protein product [Phaeothamnion confervicola]
MGQKTRTMEASEALSAAVGGAISTALCFPLEIVKTRLQADKEKNGKSILETLADVHAAGGLFRGVGYAMAQSALEKMLYFITFNRLKSFTLSNDVSVDLTLGYVAEGSHLAITLPLEVLVTRIVTQERSNVSAHTIVRDMIRDESFVTFYRGIQAYVLLCLKPAIQYAAFNFLKAARLSAETASASGRIARQPRTNLSTGEAFLLGAVARAIATVLIYPCIRAKVLIMAGRRKQTDQDSDAAASSRASRGCGAGSGNGSGSGGANDCSGDSGSGGGSGMASVLADAVRRDGVAALFRGIGPELARGVLSSAIMLATKERLAFLILAAIGGRRQRCPQAQQS